jgi:hypothetical protein
MYVSNGKIKSKRPEGLWRIPWLLWTILNFFGFFFTSMCGESKKKKLKRPKPPSERPRRTNIRSFKPGECQSKGG